MTRTPALLVAAILLTALTGCASTAQAGQTPSEPAAPTTTAAPAPVIAPKPALAFDGSCDAIIDDAAISELLGGDLTSTEGQKSERAWAVAVLGGLDCGWIEENGDAHVAFDVIPAAGLDAQIADAAAIQPNCGDAGSGTDQMCQFSAETGGYWVSGTVTVSQDAPNSAPAVADELVTRVEAAAAAAAPVAVVLPDGMWEAETDCAAFASAVDATSILGAAFTASQGNRGGAAPAGFLAASVVVGDFPCIWNGPDESRWFTSELLPGAGWAIEALGSAEGAESVDVGGAVEAVAVPTQGDASSFYATDGVNLAWVSVPANIDPASAVTLLEAVLAAASR